MFNFAVEQSTSNNLLKSQTFIAKLKGDLEQASKLADQAFENEHK